MTNESLAHALRNALASVSIPIPGSGSLNLEQYKELISGESDRELKLAVAMRQLNAGGLSELLGVLGSLFGSCIEKNEIGVAFAGFRNEPRTMPVQEFARICAVAALETDPEIVSARLTAWAAGKSISIQTRAIFSGVWLSQSIAVDSKASLKNLPFATSVKSQVAPTQVSRLMSIPHLTGATVLTINHSVQSPIYGPGSEWTLPEDTQYINELAEAIALTLNHQVRPLCSWVECEDAVGFPTADSVRIHYLPPWPNVRMRLHVEQMSAVLGSLAKRQAIPNSQIQLKSAISRWIDSRSRIDPTDQFIDLRIALELLYLTGESGEFGFRMSNYGAWHLGATREERIDIQKTLNDAYGAGSKAIHTGEIKSPNWQLLKKAQDYVRQGILKRLNEPSVPKWKEIILG